ncbi:recombinase family protein [Bacillus cereus]|uniref:recombinase family protein n=1 Tax=Bacillus cereus TaxID=1396 RepID=UPI000BECB370|nr:recombinase family protein [Bacillus cereus]PEE36215.1 hypothetical protein CON59_12770 [Bacillus cereus]PET51717.1 hypothetical protein CN523_03005 [Bacillus cereus]PEV74112.1 hypothetical protein CN429_25540 [Bacillus cereus]PFA53784.1 hypothetical protein CN389_19780 [Bacillus cereus]PFD63113.1 hypothetical protein CN271_27315 [Bacillus cereus]
MKVGYVRVSTIDQNLDLQINSLKSYGCEKIFQDKLSGVKDNKSGLEEVLRFCCKVFGAELICRENVIRSMMYELF